MGSESSDVLPGNQHRWLTRDGLSVLGVQSHVSDPERKTTKCLYVNWRCVDVKGVSQLKYWEGKKCSDSGVIFRQVRVSKADIISHSEAASTTEGVATLDLGSGNGFASAAIRGSISQLGCKPFFGDVSDSELVERSDMGFSDWTSDMLAAAEVAASDSLHEKFKELSYELFEKGCMNLPAEGDITLSTTPGSVWAGDSLKPGSRVRVAHSQSR